jgi:hypothetical protein
MNYRPNAQPFRDQVLYEWRSATADLRKRKKVWAVGFVSVSLLFAIVAGAIIRPSLSEIPLVLLSGFIHSLRFLSILAFIWFWVVTHLIHSAVHNWAEARWTDHERKKKPNQSFPVPYWRFWIFAFLPSMFVFLTLSVPLAYVLFVLPNYNNVLDRALSVFLPVG